MTSAIIVIISNVNLMGADYKQQKKHIDSCFYDFHLLETKHKRASNHYCCMTCTGCINEPYINANAYILCMHAFQGLWLIDYSYSYNKVF